MRKQETETFVEEYPLKKDGEPEIDLSDLSSIGRFRFSCSGIRDGAITDMPVK